MIKAASAVLALALTFPVAGRAEVPSDVKATIQRFADAWNSKNPANMSKIYTSDVIYVQLEPVLALYSGRDGVQKQLDGVWPNAKSISLNPLDATTKPDGIWVTTDYEIVGNSGSKVPGHMVLFLRKEGSDWMVAVQSFARGAVQ